MKIGIPVSPGIGIGKVLFIDGKEICPAADTISENDITNEIDKMNAAMAKSREQLEFIHQELLSRDDKNAEIIQANIFILEDPMLHQQIIDIIKGNHYNAPYTIKQVVDEQIKILKL